MKKKLQKNNQINYYFTKNYYVFNKNFKIHKKINYFLISPFFKGSTRKAREGFVIYFTKGKIFLFSFLLVIFNLYYPQTINASCSIQNGPDQIILDYIKNNKKVINNIQKEIKKNDQKISTTDYGINILKIFNQILMNWNGSISYFNYYIIYPISNDIPYQIKRDHKILERENEGLNKYLKNIIKKGQTEIDIPNACGDQIKNCNLSGNAGEIVGKLIQNNTEILDLYRKTIMPDSWYNFEYKGEPILVSEDFEEQLQKSYGYKRNICTATDGSFWSTVGKRLKKIESMVEESEKGLEQWRKAGKLLSGIDTKEEKELEKKLLAKELQKQGVSVDAASAMLDSLDTGFSLVNNPISSTFMYLVNSVGGEIKKFDKGLFEDFENAEEKSEDMEEKSINDLLNDKIRSNVDMRIASSIAEVYHSQIPNIATTNKQTNNLKTKIINLHGFLDISIETLDKTCKYAVKVCNEQSTGIGFCGSCD